MSSSSGNSPARLIGEGFDRSLYFAVVRNVDEWPERLVAPQAHFGVLLVMDASAVQDERLSALARKLLDQGMAYFCGWGPGCSRVHDVVDMEIVQRDLPESADVMTTWHENEDLDDALWFAAFAAPADDYTETCRAVLAIVVDQPEWSARVEADLRNFEAFNDRVLSRDELSERS